jgi:hypothetical protein
VSPDGRWHWLAILALAACSKSSPPAAAKTEPAVATHEDRHEAQAAPAKLTLAVEAGGTTTVWAEPEFLKVPRMAGAASDGEARDTWSLRELVHTLVGPAARIATVVGPDGAKEVSADDWNDAHKTPILHTTRRGTLKFRWADATGAWGDTVVRDVSKIVIAN